MILLMNIPWNSKQEKQFVCVFPVSLHAEIYRYSSLGKNALKQSCQALGQHFVIPPKWWNWCSSETRSLSWFCNYIMCKIRICSGWHKSGNQVIYVILLLFLWWSTVGSQLHLVWCYVCCLEQSCTSYFPVAVQYSLFLAALCCWWYSYQRSVIGALW